MLQNFSNFGEKGPNLTLVQESLEGLLSSRGAINPSFIKLEFDKGEPEIIFKPNFKINLDCYAKD